MVLFLTGLFICGILKVAIGETDRLSDPRIFGGQDATSVPWIVPLFTEFGFRYCGGSIIHEKWVLTAAHCVINVDPSDIFVVGGLVDYFDRSSGQHRNIYSVRIHEDFDEDYGYNDVALLELESPFCFDERVAKIDLATDDDPYEDGQEYTVAGWGVNDKVVDYYYSTTSLLQELRVPQYDQAACKEVFYAEFDYVVDNLTQICVGGIVGESPCEYDSGGPLWMEVNSKPVLYGAVLHGVVSGGPVCASTYPAIFARLSAYQEWIESRVGLPYSEFSDGLGYFIVQGAKWSSCTDATDSSCTARSVNPNELWNVRCCADTDPNGWRQNSHYGCSVYTNSKVPQCYTTDWKSAVERCDAEDARLCTKEELENRCSAGSGCGFNNKMVWSSTADTRYYIVKGAAGRKCSESTAYACNPRPVSIYEKWNVRCCADADPGGWLQNTGCSVYTASRVPKCASSDWLSAVELCREAGGRLCTREELESGCAKNGGCRLNRYMVWSATEYSVECSF